MVEIESITVSTFNAQGMGSPEKVDNIIFQSSQLKKDNKTPNTLPQVVCVQQANLPPCGDKLQHYKWICSGQFGSAILISKSSTLEGRCFEQVCKEICVAEVVTPQGVVLKVISCYVPPSTDYVHVTKDLWTKLSEILKSIPVTMNYVLAGDFNAEIGKEDVSASVGYRTLFGPKLNHKISNENGTQLAKLAMSFHSPVLSTYGRYSSTPECYTYKDGTENSQRSYIIVPRHQIPIISKEMLQDCWHSWLPGYKSALVSRILKFSPNATINGIEKSNIPSLPVTVSCWNVQGVSPSTLDKALNDLDIHLVCLQDIFLTSEDDVKTNNYTWFTSKNLWGKNVGILIKNGSNYSMASFEAISESLCVGNVTFNGTTIKVVCCSLPLYTDSLKFQEVTKRLVDLVKNFPEGTTFVVAGDFNTHVNYTILDDILVFEEGDENALFLKQLMKECKMELPYMPRSHVTHISENRKRNSSLLFMSSSCMMKYSHKYGFCWVPLIENAIVTLSLFECAIGGALFPTANAAIKNDNSGKNDAPIFEKVECIDGLMYVTKFFFHMKRINSTGTTEHQAYRFISLERMAQDKTDEKSDLPEEIITKYKNSPPPLDELLSMLGKEFTLYLGFLQESVLPKGVFSEIIVPFESLGRGMLLAECMDVLDEKTKEPVKRIVRIRWNGIVVHEQEGGKFESYKRIFNKGQSVLLNTLGKHCFTVKARSSFYNNGLPPLCKNEDELKKVFRVMTAGKFIMYDLTRIKEHIEHFDAVKPCHELVFGPEFARHNCFEKIKKYVLKTKHAGFRYWKSTKDLDHYDHMGVFINHSPTTLRNMLMAIPQHRDLRFQLIPPCGSDNVYLDWIEQWNEKIIPNEYFKPYESIMDSTKLLPLQTIYTMQQTMKKQGTKPRVDLCNGSKVKLVLEDHCGNESNKRSTGFVEEEIRVVDKYTQHKLMKCQIVGHSNRTVGLTNRGKTDWIRSARELTDLPQADVDKYRETPPQMKVLSRILGDDFTLYYGFGRESEVVTRNTEVLAISFEALGHGGVMMENIEVIKQGQPSARLVKFKWNGICVHMEAGSVSDSFKNISVNGQQTLVNRLGQLFYAVHAKMSYFNGTLPVCNAEGKLPETLKVVEESDIPSFDINQPTEEKAEAIKNYITEFFSTNDSDVELFFGPKFRFTELLEHIKRYILDSNFGYRLLKSKESFPFWDCIAFFIRRTPLEIRDKLMKILDHQDSKFVLIPPCEFYKKSHYEWIMSWAAENYIEEYKLMFEKEKADKAKAEIKLQKRIKAEVSQRSNLSRTDNQREEPNSTVISGRKRDRQHLEHVDKFYGGAHKDTSRSQPSNSDYRYDWSHTGNENRNHYPDAYDRSEYHQDSQPQERYELERKRPRQQLPPRSAKVEKPRWDDLAPLVIVWPINIRSEHERNPRAVLEANFPTEVSLDSNNRVAVFVTLPLRNRREKEYCLCKGDDAFNATKTALDLLVKHSSVIKYNLNYLPLDGQAPNFIRYKIPCQTNPRTYITLSWAETGALTEEKIAELFESFKDSLNEDLYFDKDYYSHDMKKMILDLAPKFGLKVRHCGSEQRLVDRYVCVYKTKPKDEVLEEVLKMRDFHPKYRLATNKLPPRLGLNIF